MKKRVLLIYPSILYSPFEGEHLRIKMGILSLFSYLKKKGYEVNVLDLENEIGRPLNDIERKAFIFKAENLIKKYDFDIAAISCWLSFNYLAAKTVAEICKELNSKCKVVVGGNHPTVKPDDFIYEGSPFDYVVRGEGENIFEAICDGKIGKKYDTLVLDGTQLSLSEKYHINWDDYGYEEVKNDVPIFFSRGCPYKCTYCTESCNYSVKYRIMDAKTSAKMIIEAAKSNRRKEFTVCDPSFGFIRNWRREFLKELIDSNFDKLVWVTTRVDFLDEDDVELMSKLNFQMHLGFETASEGMLKIMGKTEKSSKYLDNFSKIIPLIHKKNIPYVVQLLFNHPGETKKSIDETIEFMGNFFESQENITGYISPNDFIFFPGNKVYENLKDYENQFGTRIMDKNWWKTESDQSKLGRSVIASHELNGMIGAKDYWEQRIKNINSLCCSRKPASINHF